MSPDLVHRDGCPGDRVEAFRVVRPEAIRRLEATSGPVRGRVAFEREPAGLVSTSRCLDCRAQVVTPVERPDRDPRRATRLPVGF